MAKKILPFQIITDDQATLLEQVYTRCFCRNHNIEDIGTFRRIIAGGSRLVRCLISPRPGPDGKPEPQFRIYYFFPPTYGTLLDYMKGEKKYGLSARIVRNLIRQVLEMVAYAHKRHFLFKVHSLANFVFADKERYFF